jgi:hypothetical protein
MENPAIEHKKSLDDYLAASSEHNAALRAWSEAPDADNKKLFLVVAEAKIRLDIAHAAWARFQTPRTLATHR